MSEQNSGAYDGLPDRVRHDPAFLAWQIDQHEARITSLEQAPSSMSTIAEGAKQAFPILRLIILMLALILGALGHLAPEMVAKMIKSGWLG